MKNNIKLKIENNPEIKCFFEEDTIYTLVSFCPQIEEIFTSKDLKEIGAPDEEVKKHKDTYSVTIKDLIDNGFSFKITPFQQRIITV